MGVETSGEPKVPLPRVIGEARASEKVQRPWQPIPAYFVSVRTGSASRTK